MRTCPGRPLGLPDASSAVGGAGRELALEGAADGAAAEEGLAAEHLRPGESHGPPGAGGELCAGQGPAAQQPSAEEKQAAGRCPGPPTGHQPIWGGRGVACLPASAAPPAASGLPSPFVPMASAPHLYTGCDERASLLTGSNWCPGHLPFPPLPPKPVYTAVTQNWLSRGWGGRSVKGDFCARERNSRHVRIPQR